MKSTLGTDFNSPYTNTLEAFYSSYSKGYRNIEIDILETKDGHIVGAHDWKTFRKFTNYHFKEDINITFTKNARILSKYHVIMIIWYKIY